MCDVITIGSATMDVFVESDDANIVSVYTKNKNAYTILWFYRNVMINLICKQ